MLHRVGDDVFFGWVILLLARTILALEWLRRLGIEPCITGLSSFTDEWQGEALVLLIVIGVSVGNSAIGHGQ